MNIIELHRMRLRTICKSKIHHGTVTRADLDYVGSIGIDAELMQRADIVTGEKVAVWNVSTGARIETYAIPLAPDSGEIVVNGAAARHFQAGDRVIIVAFVLTDEVVEPRMLLVDAENRFASWLPAEGDVQLAGPIDLLLRG
jgi:aspartate 1-decarboxylase